MGKLRIGPPPKDDNEGDFSFAIHHMLPLRYGGVGVEDFHIAPPPPIDIEAASQPVNLGFPPILHVPLPPPDAFRPVAPPLVGGRSTRSARPAPPRQFQTTPGELAGSAPAAKGATPETRAGREPALKTPPAPSRPSAAAGTISEPSRPQPVERVRPAAKPADLPAARPAPQAIIEEEEPSLFEALDPLYALALYLAAGLGTIFAIDDLEARYTVLWSVLILLGGALTMVDTRRARRGVGSLNLAWGIGYAVLIGGLLLAFVAQGLFAASRLLFPDNRYSLPALFQTLVLLGPLGETIFFRGMLQERRGILASVIGAGLGTLIFYWPAGGGDAVGTVIAVAGFLTALAGLYSYIRQRYGLAAAFACQVTLNLMLFFIPRLLFSPRP